MSIIKSPHHFLLRIFSSLTLILFLLGGHLEFSHGFPTGGASSPSDEQKALIKTIFDVEFGVCCVGVVFNVVLVVVFVRIVVDVERRGPRPLFHPSNFVVLVLSDLAIVTLKVAAMKGALSPLPYKYRDLWLRLFVPASVGVAASFFLCAIVAGVVALRGKQRRASKLNHLWLLSYVVTGILIPASLYVSQFYYGENKIDTEEARLFSFTRRSMSLFSFVAFVFAVVAIVVSFVAGVRVKDIRLQSTTIVSLSIFFLLTHFSWFFYHDEDFTDVCRLKALEDWESEDYYDNLDFSDDCSMKLSVSVDLCIVCSASFKLFLLLCCGGAAFRRALCCCGCCGCSKECVGCGAEEAEAAGDTKAVKWDYVATNREADSPVLMVEEV